MIVKKRETDVYRLNQALGTSATQDWFVRNPDWRPFRHNPFDGIVNSLKFEAHYRKRQKELPRIFAGGTAEIL